MNRVTAPSWWLDREVWYAMTREQRREHCYKVAAYFKGELRRRLKKPGDEKTDWHDAVREINAEIERWPGMLAG